MPTETELKLRLPPQYISQIKQSLPLKTYCIRGPISRDLYSIYYDSPRLVLKEHRISLRTRKIDQRWIQTIKSGGKIKKGLHQHNEWESAITNKRPDFSQIQDPYLKTFFADQQLRQSLHPVFITDFIRTIYLLEPSTGFQIEFCLDEGKVVANQQTQTICEIELELIAGKPSQLLKFSEILQDHCQCPLTPENTNKAMRGYALLQQL